MLRTSWCLVVVHPSFWCMKSRFLFNKWVCSKIGHLPPYRTAIKKGTLMMTHLILGWFQDKPISQTSQNYFFWGDGWVQVENDRLFPVESKSWSSQHLEHCGTTDVYFAGDVFFFNNYYYFIWWYHINSSWLISYHFISFHMKPYHIIISYHNMSYHICLFHTCTPTAG